MAVACAVSLVVGAMVSSVAVDVTTEREVERRYHAAKPWLDETPKHANERRRLWAGAEALALDRGDIVAGDAAVAIVARATGISSASIRAARNEWRAYEAIHTSCLPVYQGSRGSAVVYVGLTVLAAGFALLLTMRWSRRPICRIPRALAFDGGRTRSTRRPA